LACGLWFLRQQPRNSPLRNNQPRNNQPRNSPLRNNLQREETKPLTVSCIRRNLWKRDPQQVGAVQHERLEPLDCEVMKT